jgi:hypothetical protein
MNTRWAYFGRDFFRVLKLQGAARRHIPILSSILLELRVPSPQRDINVDVVLFSTAEATNMQLHIGVFGKVSSRVWKVQGLKQQHASNCSFFRVEIRISEYTDAHQRYRVVRFGFRQYSRKWQSSKAHRSDMSACCSDFWSSLYGSWTAQRNIGHDAAMFQSAGAANMNWSYYLIRPPA